ncbi:MAG: ATP-binding cassette domain-containing protein, partial [Candidatus Latescibacterota bacterium]
MSLLQIENLGVRFHAEDGGIDAVHSASLEIGKGETVALVGESGSGKSVTALSVLQLLPYPRASHPRGSVRFGGEELLGAKADRMRALRGGRISMIFQEPMTSLNPLHSIEKQISETLILHRGLDKAQARTRTVELLRQVGLPNVEERLDAWPHQLSGGQRQRVMIAMALANEPDLLIADEPTTALDVTVQAQILQLLKDLQQQLGMAILLITHDLGIVRHMADRVYVMKDGNIVEHNAVRALFSDPQHDYTKLLINAEPSGNPPAIDQRAPLVIETRDLKVHFPILRGLLRRTVGHVKAVDGISLEVRAGQTLGVVGESGSGKSTLG